MKKRDEGGGSRDSGKQGRKSRKLRLINGGGDTSKRVEPWDEFGLTVLQSVKPCDEVKK